MKYMLRTAPVNELRESTKETQPSIKPEAREHLNEIYFLRRQQERYEDKEIGTSPSHYLPKSAD